MYPPPRSEGIFQQEIDLRVCRGMLYGGSRTFHAASLLLPRRVREPATAVYAFCRQADDAVDLAVDPAAALGELDDRLRRVYAGEPRPEPADRAFARVVMQHRIPRSVPAALFEGFHWDGTGRRYDTLAELCDYAVRVAGTVAPQRNP